MLYYWYIVLRVTHIQTPPSSYNYVWMKQTVCDYDLQYLRSRCDLLRGEYANVFCKQAMVTMVTTHNFMVSIIWGILRSIWQWTVAIKIHNTL